MRGNRIVPAVQNGLQFGHPWLSLLIALGSGGTRVTVPARRLPVVRVYLWVMALARPARTRPGRLGRPGGGTRSTGSSSPAVLVAMCWSARTRRASSQRTTPWCGSPAACAGTGASVATPGSRWPRPSDRAGLWSPPSTRSIFRYGVRPFAIGTSCALIAVERGFHVLIFALLAVAIFLFIPHRHALQSDYAHLLRDLRDSTFGGNVGRGGVWTLVNRLFTIREVDLIVIGVALVVYCLVLSAEIVGLWRARRWAEYLTFVESCVLLPYEIYELAHSVTVLKVAGLILNLAILLYLAIVHRLFGVRGGAGAVRARYEAEGGRPAVERATPDPAIGAPGICGRTRPHLTVALRRPAPSRRPANSTGASACRVSGPPDRPVAEATAASTTFATPASPAALGCTGNARASGTMGSIQRTDSGVQALCGSLGTIGVDEGHLLPRRPPRPASR